MVILLYGVIEQIFYFVKMERNEIPDLPEPANCRLHYTPWHAFGVTPPLWGQHRCRP